MKSFIPRSFFSALFAAAVAFGSAPSALAETQTVDGVTYTYSVRNSTAYIGSGGSWGVPAITNTTAGTLTIPAALGGYPVGGIQSFAFFGCSNLTAVVAPDSVSQVGDYAFSGCTGLTNVVLGTGVEYIGYQAFMGCSGLKDLMIPDQVTSVGYQAFMGCSGLKDMMIPDQVTRVGDETFRGCTGLTNVVLGAGVKSLGDQAFMGCSGLKDLMIPDQVTSVGDETFRGCTGLTNLTIGADVAWIGEGLCRNCPSLAMITVAARNASFKAVDGVLYDWAQTRLLACPAGAGKTSVNVPATVEQIDESAFFDCSTLTNATISPGVKLIGSGAFSGTGIENEFFKLLTPPAFLMIDGWVCGYSDAATGDLALPSGTRGIEDGALSDCIGLTSLVIPDGIGRIGNEVFRYCGNLTNVTLGADVKSIGADAFGSCRSLKRLTIPDAVTNIGENAFFYCRNLTNVVLGTGVESLGYGAFMGCSGLASLTIPANVTSIGGYAFRDCSALLEVDYLGNAPTIYWNEIYYGTPAKLTNFVASGTTGWNGRAGSSSLPETWPVNDYAARPLTIRIPAGSVLVVFDGNGGETFKQAAVIGKPLGTLPAGILGPGGLVGWFTDPTNGTQVTAAMTVPATAVTYYAHWTPIAPDVALDCTNLVFTTGGDADWFGQEAEKTNGASAMRSGAIPNGGSSWLETTVTGPTILKFHWKVSSEDDYDFLTFSVDGTNIIASISGTDVDWARVGKAIPAGAHTVRWTYAKDESGSYEDDCGWVDGVSFAPPAPVTVTFDGNGGTASVPALTRDEGAPYGTLPTASREGYALIGWYTAAIGGSLVTAQSEVSDLVTVLYAHWGVPLGTALDNEALAFTTDGDSFWYGQTNVSSYGGSAAQSGAITDLQTTCLRTTVTGPGTFTFSWRVSSEEGWDCLTFSTNGVMAEQISGVMTGWKQATCQLPAGTNTLEWAYSKDESDYDGEDCGWVDQVIWRPVSMTVAFNANGGTASAASVTFPFDAPYGTLLPTATREGYTFAGWYTAAAGGTPVTATSTVTLAVTALYAHWAAPEILAITDPLAAGALPAGGTKYAATFAGLLYGDVAVGTQTVTTVRGLATLKVSGTSAKGKLSAKITLQNKKLSLSSKSWGSADTNGSFSATLAAKSGETLSLTVRDGRMQGTLTGGSVDGTLELDGCRNRFAESKDATGAAAKLAGFLGAYTFALPMEAVARDGGVDAVPDGAGFLSVTVRAKGAVRVTGMLGDGTKVSCSTALLDFGTEGGEMGVPVFAPLYSKNGWFGAMLWVNPDGTAFIESDYGWQGAWRKPGKGADGFTAALGLEGGRLDAGAVPSALAFATTGAPEYWYRGAAIDAVAGALPDGLAVGFGGGKFTVAKATSPKKSGGAYAYNGATDAGLKLTLAASTGVVKGSYKLYYDSGAAHKTASVKINGVLLPGGVSGFGLVTETDPALKGYNKKRSVGITLE